MALFRFFRTPKPQQYRYIPRYYDPEKDDLKDRVSHSKGQSGNDPEAMKARIASGLRRRTYVDQEFRRKQTRKSNMILIGVILVLIIITYQLLTKHLPEVIQLLE